MGRRKGKKLIHRLFSAPVSDLSDFTPWGAECWQLLDSVIQSLLEAAGEVGPCACGQARPGAGRLEAPTLGNEWEAFPKPSFVCCVQDTGRGSQGWPLTT